MRGGDLLANLGVVYAPHDKPTRHRGSDRRDPARSRDIGCTDCPAGRPCRLSKLTGTTLLRDDGNLALPVGQRNRDGTSGNNTSRVAVFVGMAAASFATDIERRL